MGIVEDMETLQWLLLLATAVAAGVATYAYNDQRDGALRRVLLLLTGLGVVSTGLLWLTIALTPPASSVPRCDFSSGAPVCESSGEASRRAAGESLDFFSETYLTGPLKDAGAIGLGALVGLGVAAATGRKPTDGRKPDLVTGE